MSYGCFLMVEVRINTIKNKILVDKIDYSE